MNIGISAEVCQKVASKLSKILANEYVLQVKSQNFHWNVESSDFGQLHAFFEQHYNKTADIIDEIAERIRSLGHFSLGSMAEFIQHATLKEDIGGALKDSEMLKRLLLAHEEIICQLRTSIQEIKAIGDAGTENFLTDIMERHEKIAWMTRAHLIK